MLTSELDATGPELPVDCARLDPNLCSLLDHIAVELAEEYVRLMEAAADAEIVDDPPEARGLNEGDQR